jgi:hypothetical protein
MTFYIITYALIGIIWSFFCVYMTLKLKFKKISWYSYIPGILINTSFWPISMIYAIKYFKRSYNEQSKHNG